MKGASDRYLRELAERWRRSEGEPRDAVDTMFRDLMAGLGPFSREEIEVLCRGVSVAAMATLMASLGRSFRDPEEVLTFVQLLACRAAVEAENARRA
jgi:cytochrome P450